MMIDEKEKGHPSMIRDEESASEEWDVRKRPKTYFDKQNHLKDRRSSSRRGTIWGQLDC